MSKKEFLTMLGKILSSRLGYTLAIVGAAWGVFFLIFSSFGPIEDISFELIIYPALPAYFVWRALDFLIDNTKLFSSEKERWERENIWNLIFRKPPSEEEIAAEEKAAYWAAYAAEQRKNAEQSKDE